jgi:hypothetical protein
MIVKFERLSHGRDSTSRLCSGEQTKDSGEQKRAGKTEAGGEHKAWRTKGSGDQKEAIDRISLIIRADRVSC